MLAFLARLNLRGLREADELLAARTEALDAPAAGHRARPVPLLGAVLENMVSEAQTDAAATVSEIPRNADAPAAQRVVPPVPSRRELDAILAHMEKLKL